MMLPRRDPYLWIHFAGLATVPLWLDLCLAGLAVGDPIVPPWLELTTLGWVGTVPILWMQLQRPFYVFSLLVLALRPDRLSEDRRRCLTLQRQWLSRGVTIAGAVLLFLLLVWLYRLAPVAATTTPFANQTRTMGWLICAIAFFFANLFTQVPATVLGAMLTDPRAVSATSPYPAESIRRGFMVMGFPVGSFLADLTLEPTMRSATPIDIPPRPPSIPTSTPPEIAAIPGSLADAADDAAEWDDSETVLADASLDVTPVATTPTAALFSPLDESAYPEMLADVELGQRQTVGDEGLVPAEVLSEVEPEKGAIAAPVDAGTSGEQDDAGFQADRETEITGVAQVSPPMAGTVMADDESRDGISLMDVDVVTSLDDILLEAPAARFPVSAPES